MKDLKSINLVLFFTRNTSLRAWDEIGVIERESSLYYHLSERGVKATFVTYGNADEVGYADRIPGIRIVCNRWGLTFKSYTRLLTTVYPLFWQMPVIFKSNQVKGAEVALQAARRFGRPFVARCGYLYSSFMEQQYGSDSRQAQRARDLEREVFTDADRVIVTTPVMRQKVIQDYSVPEEHVHVIPNYVDTKHFSPNSNGHRAKQRLCFVGRLIEQKNLFALLDAVRGLEVELVIVGDDVLRDQLQEKVKAERLPVRFLGSVPNRQLPGIMNRCSVFILPSFYEGHPKALLEAMACGLPVIGTNVPGIAEIIRDGETGLLCGVSPGEIREAIRTMLGDATLQKRLGDNARQFVTENFAFEQIVEMEASVISELAG